MVCLDTSRTRGEELWGVEPKESGADKSGAQPRGSNFDDNAFHPQDQRLVDAISRMCADYRSQEVMERPHVPHADL